MRILVTGGMGFIGHHLVRLLTDHNPHYKITIVDNLSKGREEFLSDIKDRFYFYNIDITDKGALEKCFKETKPDIIIHLAAMHFIPECDQNPKKTEEVNIGGTDNLVNLANNYKTKHFIFISSAAVYDSGPGKKIEDMIPQPGDVYGQSKLVGEKIVQDLFRSNWSILRSFNVIGTGETNDHLIPAILHQLAQGSKLKLGNLSTARDYYSVKDFVSGISHVIANETAYGQIFNFGSGYGVTAEHIISELEGILGEKISVTEDENRKRAGDRPSLIASIAKAEKLLGWKPKYSLKETLEEIIARELKRGFGSSSQFD